MLARAKIAGGAVTGDKVKDATLAGRDVLDNSLKRADIDESTLSNIGGGGAAGGDLTGTYPAPLIREGSIGTRHLKQTLTVVDNELIPPNGVADDVRANRRRGRNRRSGAGEKKGERGDSNPRPPGPQPGALPTELRPPGAIQSSAPRRAGARLELARCRPGVTVSLRAVVWAPPGVRRRMDAGLRMDSDSSGGIRQ